MVTVRVLLAITEDSPRFPFFKEYQGVVFRSPLIPSERFVLFNIMVKIHAFNNKTPI